MQNQRLTKDQFWAIIRAEVHDIPQAALSFRMRDNYIVFDDWDYWLGRLWRVQ